MSSPASRLQELGIELPPAGAPKGAYQPARVFGEFVYLSGHGPMVNGLPSITGRVPSTVSVDNARAAARLTAINLLSTLAAALEGDLDRVRAICSVTGYVCADPGFEAHPSIIDAASDLFVDVFGERGRHARAAVGVSSLPFRIPVEISLVAAISHAKV